MTYEQACKLADQFAFQLGEHFDAVQVLVSRNLEGRTRCHKTGCGNWYARQGMAQEFKQEDQSRDLAYELSKVLTPPSEPDTY